LPADVTLVTDAGEALARVQAPRVEEVVEAPEEGETPAEEAGEGTAEEESSAE
jgi:hypothetical protein